MAKQNSKKEHTRFRVDSGHHRRIMAVMMIFGLLAFIPVGLRLHFLMISRYDYYSMLALRNQTRTTVVTADRGTIFDRNMNILAASVTVENVYLDPHELRQAQEDIDAKGLTVTTNRGIATNPAVKIKTDCQIRIEKILSELTVTPKSQMKLGIITKEDGEDDFIDTLIGKNEGK
jgi:stage V sporulation protein D (sporulation-specific penicillin-binding protein)